MSKLEIAAWIGLTAGLSLQGSALYGRISVEKDAAQFVASPAYRIYRDLSIEINESLGSNNHNGFMELADQRRDLFISNAREISADQMTLASYNERKNSATNRFIAGFGMGAITLLFLGMSYWPSQKKSK